MAGGTIPFARLVLPHSVSLSSRICSISCPELARFWALGLAPGLGAASSDGQVLARFWASFTCGSRPVLGVSESREAARFWALLNRRMGARIWASLGIRFVVDFFVYLHFMHDDQTPHVFNHSRPWSSKIRRQLTALPQSSRFFCFLLSALMVMKSNRPYVF